MSLIPDFLLEKSAFGVPNWWIVIGFILLIILVFKSFKPKREEYKKINLSKEINKNFKNYFNSYSETATLKDNYKLMIGYKDIGIIKKISEINFALVDYKGQKLPKIKKPEQVVAEEIKAGRDKPKKKKYKIKKQPKDFYGFEVYSKNIIGKLFFILGLKPQYYIIDKDLINLQNNIYNVNSHAQFSNFLGVNIFSQSSKEYITDIVHGITRQKELEELVNFTPKMVFLELKASKFAQRGREISAIEKRKYKDRQEYLFEEET